MQAREHLLDVSQLAPPQPLFEALEAAERLGRGEYLHLLLSREPHMLYPQLMERRLSYRAVDTGQAVFELLVWSDADPLAAAACAD